jgi:hypothetical protein
MIAWQADAPVDVQRPQAMGFPDPRARIMIVVPDYWAIESKSPPHVARRR